MSSMISLVSLSHYHASSHDVLYQCCLFLQSLLFSNTTSQPTLILPFLYYINKIAKCTIETDLQVPTTCTPIKGYLTLYSSPTNNHHHHRDLSSARHSILNTIQTYIEKRTHLYTSETILAVSYVGIRTSVGVGLLNPDLLMRPEERKRSSGSSDNNDRRSLISSIEVSRDTMDYMRLGVGGVVVGCLLVVLLVFRRVNHRHVVVRQNLEVVVWMWEILWKERKWMMYSWGLNPPSSSRLSCVFVMCCVVLFCTFMRSFGASFIVIIYDVPYIAKVMSR